MTAGRRCRPETAVAGQTSHRAMNTSAMLTHVCTTY
jgi:hypothetical protein